MSGWPSTTGNPSGGGRWNNEPDDGYDDYEEEGSVSSYSQRATYRDTSYSNREHNRAWCQSEREGLRHDMKPERDRLSAAVDEQQYLVQNLGRLIGKPYGRYEKWSDYGSFARKYFGTDSLAEFAKPITESLAEIQKKVSDFKNEHLRSMQQTSRILSFPKVSERKHILISEGFIDGPFGTHVINGRVTDGCQYIWKSDLNDDTESYKIVSSRYSGELTAEEVNDLSRLEEEFLDLYRELKEKEVAVIQCYEIFRPDYRENFHWMEDRENRERLWRKLDHSFTYDLENNRHADRFQELASLENPYQVIFEKIESDYEKAVASLEVCEAEKKVVEDEYKRKWLEIGHRFGLG